MGGQALANYAGYHIRLRSGLLAWQTRRAGESVQRRAWTLRRDLFALPDRDRLSSILGESGVENVRDVADEALQGRYRRFGSSYVPFDLGAAGHAPWSEYELGRNQSCSGLHPSADVKFIWEDGRLGWVYPLLRAYRISGDERYAQAFCEYSSRFLEANPYGTGCQWVSAQEVALRMVGLVLAGQVMADSIHFTSPFKERLARTIAEHAARIPPSLAYARAQNNNHLLSEAAGLYTAGLALQDCPTTHAWRETGWSIFHKAIQDQINTDGTYVQQSVNYQRLMLQLALWVRLLAVQEGRKFPAESEERLAASTRWLSNLLDEESGCLPNLGPQDGAYILPLTNSPQADYRPLLHAAGLAFWNERSITSPDGGEMALWLCPDRFVSRSTPEVTRIAQVVTQEPCVLHQAALHSWAYLRAARFTARPGHADQCHVDLWWRGLNIARDAGTYSYNAAAPWDNPLTQAAVHNTVTLNERDQMLRGGRFLYLDWAQGRILSVQKGAGILAATAEHDGYRALGALHRRTISAAEKNPGWVILDEILPMRRKAAVRRARLHWLLPDWPWEVDATAEASSRITLRLESPCGCISIRLEWQQGYPAVLTLTRAGESVYGGQTPEDYEGWVSPTYGLKEAALSLALNCEGELPLTFKTTWQFPASVE